MTCRTYGVLLSRSLDGESDAAEKLALERHLSGCNECRRTMNSWGLQKSHLRAFFARHSLDESFVRRARLARETRNLANPPAGRGRFSRPRFVLLRVAAGMLLAVLLLTQFSPKRDTDAFARVLTEGARLQVRSTPSSGWTPALLGATLRPGDWVHNPEQGIVELLLNDSAKITLQQGATAQLLGGAGKNGNEVVLVGGSIRAEGWDTGRVLQIHTPAGDIRSRGGEFVARVGETLLPQFEVNPDRSERVSGFVQVIAGVTVSRGSVEVVSHADRQDVEPGTAALFTSSHPIVTASADATPGSIEVSLHQVACARASGGPLVSRLVSSERGLRLAIEADQLPLPRLIALTTHSRVEGGEGLGVSGKLSYPPDASPAELVAAIGAATGLEISLRHEQAHSEVVFSFAQDAPARAGKGPRGFSVSRTADGLLSFAFQEIPAREAFGALRSAGVDLPQLSSESETTLLTFEAESLKPSEVRSWLLDQLRWQSLESDTVLEFVEINSSPSSSGNQTGSKAAEDLHGGTSSIASTSTQPEEVAMALSQVQPARHNSSRSGGIGAGLMQNLGQATVFLPQPSFIPNPGVPKVETGIARSQSKGADSVVTAKSDGNGLSVTVKVSRKSGQSVEETPPNADFPVGPRRVVWPVIDPSGGVGPAEAYLVYNPSSQPANTTWHGYDSAGRLLATFFLEIGTKSSALLLPSSLSGELDPGSHWETASNVPISGSVVDPSGAGSRYDGIDPERLPSLWEFRTSDFAGMGGSSRLWLINPGDNEARGLVAIVDDERVLFAQEFSLDPHAGMIWSMESLLPDFPEALRLPPGAQILVQTTEGSIAAGSAAAAPLLPAIPGEKVRTIDSLFGH